jgi:hypothetical protein
MAIELLPGPLITPTPVDRELALEVLAVANRQSAAAHWVEIFMLDFSRPAGL